MHDQEQSRCERCGERIGTAFFANRRDGEVEEWTLRCLCDGIVCRYCKRNAIHRPISNYYNEAEQGPWHVSYFGNLIPCAECRAKGVRGKGMLFVERREGELPISVAGDASGPPAWVTGATVCDQCGWARADGSECLCAGWVCRACRRRAIPRSFDTCSECAARGGNATS